MRPLPDDAPIFEFEGQEYEGRPGGIGGASDIDFVSGITLVNPNGQCPSVGLAFIGDPEYMGVPLDRIKPLTVAALALYIWACAL